MRFSHPNNEFFRYILINPFPKFTLLFVFILFIFLSFYTTPSAATLTLSEIKRIYSEIKDMKGSFIQKNYIKDMKKTEVYKGNFVIKMPSKMKWHYKGENDDTEVIIKGTDMIIYQEKLKQALRQRFDPDLYGQTPVALLSGLGNIDNDFNVEERQGNLILIPKRSMRGIISIELTPSGDEFPINSLIITDKRSNKIEIRLRDVKINIGAPDSLFEFSPPKGVRLQELR